MKLPNLRNLPSIAYVILIPLGIALFIGGIMLFFNLLTTVEGFGSIIIIVAGFFAFKFMVSASNDYTQVNKKPDSWFTAVAIVFFALMGMAIDQTGNVILNQPLALFCGSGTSLNRDIQVFHPRPGETDVVQNFTCVDKNGKEVSEFDDGQIILVRFSEYVIIGYALLYLNKFLLKRKQYKIANPVS